MQLVREVFHGNVTQEMHACVSFRFVCMIDGHNTREGQEANLGRAGTHAPTVIDDVGTSAATCSRPSSMVMGHDDDVHVDPKYYKTSRCTLVRLKL
jgi:hypothetical protein